MRSPLRSSGDGSPRPDTGLSAVTALSGVVALPARVEPVASGTGGGPVPVPEAWSPSEQLDLTATAAGLVIDRTTDRGRAGGPGRPVPSLVPWSRVQCTEAPAEAEELAAPDGVASVLVSLAVRAPDWWGGAGAWRFVVPAPDAAAFLDAVARGRTRERARGDRTTVRAGVGGRLAAAQASAARWVHSLQPGADGPRHGLGSRRQLVPVMVGLVTLLLLAGSTSLSFVSSASGAGRHTHAPVATGDDTGNRSQAAAVHLTPLLAPATSTPAPAPPSLASSAPLQPHEIFGYAPYWTLPQSSGFDVNGLTTLAYFSVDANPDGTLDQSGPGWNGYESQDLVNLVNRSHAAGDRVVLTVTDFSQSSLDAITADPGAPARLSAALIAAVSAKNLDGVNFDFEGQGSADQAGLTRLITQVSAALHAANPHWQVTMATYASAAGDAGGFYNIAALAPALDGFFVMAYDMNSQSSPSATAPLIGGGFNDTEALQQFTAVVPASKIILGVPYYGYDWPTTDGTITAQATGSEAPLSDAVIAASGHPTYWDPSTDTAWTSYQVGQQWHETYFDDPTSLALKAQLAASYHIAGLGIWALGMDGNDPAMLAALLGNSPAVKDLTTGPTSTSSSSTTAPAAPVGSGFVSSGVWDGTKEALSPVAPPASDGTDVYQGTISHFTTTDPALTCLESGPALKVWTFSTLPGVDVVLASPPDCASAMWTFSPASVTTGSGGSSTTTTTAPSPSTTTTTTTEPASTTTTSSTTTTTTTPTTDPPVGP